MTDDKKIRIMNGVQFACPTCGKTVRIGYTEDDKPIGAHDHAACETWTGMSLVDFASYARKYYSKELN